MNEEFRCENNLSAGPASAEEEDRVIRMKAPQITILTKEVDFLAVSIVNNQL